MKVGFVGLGNMGASMALNLLSRDFELVVHNRTRAKAERLAEHGATIAETPAELAAAVDVVLSCLVRPADIELVYLGPDGLAAGVRQCQVFVDTGTNASVFVADMARRLSDLGVDFVDAPISGGVGGAKAASLSVTVGPSDEAFRRIEPVLRTIGRNIFHLGPTGAGTAIKLCNQMLVAAGQALAAEGLVFGVKAGLKPQDIYDVVRVSSGYSYAFERITRDFILKRNFEAAATVDLILKDLDYVLQAADGLGTRTLFAALARQAFIETRSLGHGQSDLASVVLPLESQAGVQVGPV